MLVEEPKDSFILYAIAKEYESLSNYPDALEYFLLIRKNDNMYVGLYYHLGKLYEKMEDTGKAMEAYEAGIIVAKKIPDFHALSELNNAKLNLEMEL
ncbi:MAG: tetratricopeptide repeat protein [Saprospiraceae bacterium]|nr:tetratricopeptide repeat protein [Saprospiraceae bacterium]MBL0027337.1 tetratricopeptide repeat protein [Saprospiraceae bacterium]